MPVWGRSSPIDAKMLVSSFARPSPAAIPTIEPASPIASASATTERSTWRLVAPSARSSASSRERWATVIDRLFWIVKAPTNTAIPPNTSRNTRMKPTNDFRPSSVKRSCSAAVCTLY